MGYYINQTSKGQSLPGTGKAEALIEDGAEETDSNTFKENMVCVIENRFFDAAAYAYSQDEYEEFKRPDGRLKTWLIHPEAKKLSGYN